MTKKKVLEESTVRAFMKLANLQPLAEEFISEKYGSKEEEMEEGGGQIPFTSKDRKSDERDAHADVTSEAKEEEEETLKEESEEEEEEGSLKEVDGEEDEEESVEETKTPSSKREAVKGAPKPQKMKGQADHKMKPAPKSSKNMVKEEMEDEGAGMAPPAGMEGEEMTPSDEAGEGADHQDRVKDALQKMLAAMSDIAREYGVDMSVTDTEEAPEEMGPEDMESGEDMEGGAEGEEEEMDEASALQEAVKRVTKRVAARLLKKK